MSDTLQSAAMELHDFGLNVVAINPANKKPLMKWKDLQTRKQSSNELDTIIHLPGLKAIAVVCGCSWNRLAVRDFDSMAAAENWKSRNRSLAKELPCVTSGRGIHYWFSADPFKSKAFDDGELKSIGNLAIVPPSLHDRSKKLYQWINPLRDRLPEVDPSEFLPINTVARNVTESTEEISSVLSVLPVLSVTPAIELEIGQCLPNAEGQRHHKLFELARRLRAFPEYTNAMSCQAAVRQWHKLALPAIGTKSWDETWSDFIDSWPRVRSAFGTGSVAEAIKRARLAEFPAHLADQYESPDARLLLKLCLELDRDSRPNPFFLSCPTAAQAIGIERMAAWRYFRRMVAEGLLQVVGKHTASKATRYRWIGKGDVP